MTGDQTSTTAAFGAFVFTELMPFSIAEVDEYISLFPITWPLPAFRVKNGEPLAEVLRSKLSSFAAFFFTDSMPFSAALFDSYISLLKMISPLPAFRLK